MPTPIGHAIAGSALAVSSARRSNNRWIIAFIIVFSVLPDLDIVPGFFVGDVNRYHRLFSHSLLFVTAAGLAGALALWLLIHCNFKYCLFWFIGAGYLHLFLDILTLDKSEPFGCPLFMPFSDQYVIFPVHIFLDLHRTSVSNEFFQSLFIWHNFKLLCVELGVTVPVLLWTLWKKHKSYEQSK